MAKLVSPKVFLIGATNIDPEGLNAYLAYAGLDNWVEECNEAARAGLTDFEVLSSFMSKVCYRSFQVGNNSNITKVRDIGGNVANVFKQGHGSILRHFQLNFVVTGCSRVLTHELVRHGIGTAFSQTSGRYCRLDSIDLVWDPILDPVKDLFLDEVRRTEGTVYLAECYLGLRKPNPKYPRASPDDCFTGDPTDRTILNREVMWLPDETFNFDKKKKITSAIRRIAPNGQANEIGFSCNVGSLRHIVMLRTPGPAEQEIRDVVGQIYYLVKEKFPGMFQDARTRTVDGRVEVYGMRMQPYDAKPLEDYTDQELVAEVARRRAEAGQFEAAT